MDCVPPFDEVTLPGTIVTSPNYPRNYDNNMECKMTIRFAADEIVTITLDEFNVDDYYISYNGLSYGHYFGQYAYPFPSTCDYDYVTLYDGESTNSRFYDIKLCGKYSSGEIFRTTGNVATLRFRSNNYETRSGFKIHVNNGEYNIK